MRPQEALDDVVEGLAFFFSREAPLLRRASAVHLLEVGVGLDVVAKRPDVKSARQAMSADRRSCREPSNCTQAPFGQSDSLAK